ncbi:MAG: PAS domain-containing protein [Thermomicrobiales bacterium]|nr:PAS domain-containing protein [Thermomicrobiales bacterium]
MPLDRLRYALEAATVGLWDWSIATGELWWSDNLAEIHGRPASEFDGTFERFLQFIHPGDRTAFDLALQRALEAGEDFTVDFRVSGHDGTIRWIRGQGRVFRNESGEPIRVIGIGLDVTNRRQQESAERQLGVIAESSSDAIVTVNRDGVVTGWNPGAEQLYGFSAAEMIGAPIRGIAPAEHAGEVDRILATLAAGERVANFETERCRKDGSRVFVSLSSGPICDAAGEMIGAVTIARDMTARRREEERQRLLAELGSVLNASLDAQATLQAVADLAVKQFADCCVIHLVQPDGIVGGVAIADSTPCDERAQRNGRCLSSDSRIAAAARVIQTALPELIRSLPDDPSRATEPGSEALNFAGEDSHGSGLIVPMIVRGATIGAISLYSGSLGRQFLPADLELAMELARRSALAVDNALLFARVHAAERQLRLVADNLPALVSYVDTDYRYRFVNRRYAEWFGRPSSDMIGRRVSDVTRAGGSESVMRRLELAMSGQPVRYDVEVDFPAAGARHVEIDYVPDIGPEGEVRGAVALIVDITERERIQRRVARLSELTSALAGALTEDEVAECIVRLGVAALNGGAGAVLSRSDGGVELTIRAIEGFGGGFRAGDRLAADADSCFGSSVAVDRPYLMRTWDERIVALPGQESLGAELPRGAFAVVPLTIDGRRLGAFAVAFADERAFPKDDVEFMMALAGVCAQAFDRARIYDAERQARAQAEADRARVAFLADASRILAASLDVDTELMRVMELAAVSLADWCTTHLIDEDGRLRRIGSAHRDPDKRDAVHRLETEYAILPGSFWPSARAAIASAHSWFDPVIEPDRLAVEIPDERYRALLDEIGFAGEMVVPLIAGGRMFGAMSFNRSSNSPAFTIADLRLAEELCSRTALAIENARLLKGVQASEVRYRTLFEGVADALLILDAQEVIRGGNAAAAALLGVEREGLIDLPLGAVLADPAARRVLSEDGWHGELDVDRLNGPPVPVEARASRVELPTGPAILVTMRDTTQRRTLERLQRDFLAMVTHDLRSPLAAIRVQAQLMRRRGQYSETSVEAIVGQTERIARLINTLADLVRMDSGRLDLKRQSLDLVELAEQVAEQEVANAPGRFVEIVADAPVVGEWDADRLAQVLSNLIGNALKYSGEDAAVSVEVRVDGDEATVAVIDSGVGIPEEHLAKLFERFFRADVTGAGGLGLGLYIARMLVEAHGGRIEAESEVGRGSTFRFVLPLRVVEATGGVAQV